VSARLLIAVQVLLPRIERAQEGFSPDCAPLSTFTLTPAHVPLQTCLHRRMVDMTPFCH
jgi:hypothetical protein